MSMAKSIYSKLLALSIIVLTMSITAQANEVSADKQLMCLAQNIYYEAGMESFRGKVAVAQVTINRTEDSKFPKTICGVVHQRTQIAGRIICQFSWSCNPVGKVKYLSDAWQESLMVAQQVLEANLRMERLNEALYFHAAHVNPHWGLERVARIGNHVFYSDDKSTSKK